MENINSIESSIPLSMSKILREENGEDLICFYYKVIDYVNRIEKCPIAQENIMKAYCEIEDYFYNEIKNSTQRKIYKTILNEIMIEKFLNKSNDRLEQFKVMNSVFNDYLSCISLQRDLQKDYNIIISYSPYDKTTHQPHLIKKTLQEIKKCLYNECISFIMQNCSIDHIPLFLINKSLITQKILLIYKITYDIQINHLMMKTHYGYEYLSKLYTSLSTMDLYPFDLTVFDKKTLGIIFKCFFLSNLAFLSQNQRNYAFFKGRLMTYLRIMNLHQDNEIELLTNYVKGIYSQYDKEKEVTVKWLGTEIKKSFEELKGLITNDYRILGIAKESEKTLFIILSFSLLLNNIIKVDWERDIIDMNSRFNCSACERRLLMNFLENIDTFITLKHNNDEVNNINDDIDYSYSAIDVNYYLESSILLNLFKASAADLFDSSMQYKLTMPYNDIIGNIKILDETNEELSYLFENFLEKFIESVNIEEMNISFIPHDQVNISPHICICIGTNINDKILNQLSNENKSIDYYCFSWNEKEDTTIFKSVFNFLFKDEDMTLQNNIIWIGRLLAYILASRTLFKYQTFSFIAFSQGANILKYCIRELNKIHNQIHSDCNDIINNILFINGHTTLNENDLISLTSLTSGRIINVYSKKENPHTSMISHNEIVNDIVENYDLSYLKLTDKEYQLCLNMILSIVKFN